MSLVFAFFNLCSISGVSLQYNRNSSHSLCLRLKSASYKLVVFWKKKIKSAEYVEAFLKKCGSFAPKRYVQT